MITKFKKLPALPVLGGLHLTKLGYHASNVYACFV